MARATKRPRGQPRRQHHRRGNGSRPPSKTPSPTKRGHGHGHGGHGQGHGQGGAASASAPTSTSPRQAVSRLKSRHRSSVSPEKGARHADSHTQPDSTGAAAYAAHATSNQAAAHYHASAAHGQPHGHGAASLQAAKSFPALPAAKLGGGDRRIQAGWAGNTHAMGVTAFGIEVAAKHIHGGADASAGDDTLAMVINADKTINANGNRNTNPNPNTNGGSGAGHEKGVKFDWTVGGNDSNVANRDQVVIGGATEAAVAETHHGSGSFAAPSVRVAFDREFAGVLTGMDDATNGAGTRREPFNYTPMAVNSISPGPPHVTPHGGASFVW